MPLMTAAMITGPDTPMLSASGTNTGMAMVITTQQPPTANTVSPTSKNASGGIRKPGTAEPIPLMRIHQDNLQKI